MWDPSHPMRVRRAEERQLLIEVDVRRHAVGARGSGQEQTGRRLELIVAAKAGSQRRRERTGRGGHARVADQGIETGGRQIGIVVQRKRDGAVDRQTNRGRRRSRLRERGR